MIDPPYNTGNDFVYKDNFKRDREEELLESGQIDEDGGRLTKNLDSNGRYHSDWLSMMYPRLKLARNLLKDDGVIFISIDDNEIENLKKICDEIFGENNFVNVIPWKGKGGGADNKFLMVAHEYILCYSKNKLKFTVGEEKKEGEVFPKYDEEKNRRYKTQLVRKWGSNSRREDRPNLFYSIKAPDGSDVYPILPNGDDGCWRWSKSRLDEAIKNKDIDFFQEDNSWILYEKIYEPLEGEFNTKKFSTWMDYAGNTAKGSKEVKKLFDDKKLFDFPKPISFLNIICQLANVQDGDVILDFFSGSATTAHATMKLNSEDNGNRKFIMVQLPENTNEKSEAFKNGYENICQIGKERIRRVGKQLLEDSKKTNLDIGFRVLKLDSSNMKDIYFNPNDISQDNLFDTVDNIKDDRSELDLLFGVLIDWGVDLTLPIVSETIKGKDCYFVDEDSLCACFENDLDEEFIKELASREMLRVVFRDSGFASDDVKDNVSQIFKQLNENCDIKVI